MWRKNKDMTGEMKTKLKEEIIKLWLSLMVTAIFMD